MSRRAAAGVRRPGLRIIAGALRGRRLAASPRSRPTQEKVRAAVLSRWQTSVFGCRLLDLFCGSGAIGFEAWSRGARAVVLADRDLAAARRNLEALAAGGPPPPPIEVLAGELPDALSRRLLGTFDLVYADPPYDFTRFAELLAAITPLLGAGGEAALEHATTTALPTAAAGLARVASRRHGQSTLSFYRHAQPAKNPSSSS